MRILCGHLRPSAGDVLVRGTSLLHQPKAYQGLVGYCPQVRGATPICELYAWLRPG